MTFEEKMQRIQQIAEMLEDANTGLEESLKLYEEGIGLVRECSETLQKAESRMMLFNKDAAKGIEDEN